MTATTWELQAAAHVAARDARIPAELQLPQSQAAQAQNRVVDVPLDSLLTPREQGITTSNCSTILKKVASQEWSAVEVAKAFSARAIAAHQLTNCLTEVFIEEARAAELDEILKRTGKTVGPLHGLPISLKDQLDIKGQPMTMGYVGWIGRVSAENAVLVDILKEQGAILFVRTNVPQALMLAETINNVFGTTLNPYNRLLTCGGSSGGEGALLAMRGSPLGVGSDLGGSIRVPAAFQGLYGLRPSYHRIPYAGATNSMLGQEVIPSVLGPMSSTLDGLKIFFKAVVDARPWSRDAQALRLPWQEEAYQLAEHGRGKRLCFGMMLDDGLVKPEPPLRRALLETKAALEAQGHKVIDYQPLKTAEGLALVQAIFNSDGGCDVRAQLALSGEPQIGWMLKKNAEPLNTYDYWRLAHTRELYVQEQLRAWEATAQLTGTGRPIDAILAPPSSCLPPAHGTPQYIYYTSFASLCDYTSSVIPTGTFDATLDVQEPAHDFRCEADRLAWENYSPQLFEGVPIGVQIIGRKNEEEAVLRLTEIVDEGVRAQRIASLPSPAPTPSPSP